MERKIISDGKVSMVPTVVPNTVLTKAPSDDEVKVIQRSDDIDQMTSDFIVALVGYNPVDVSCDDLGIDIQDLTSIEDEFEEVLHKHGIDIYRPFIVVDKNGNNVVSENLFDDVAL